MPAALRFSFLVALLAVIPLVTWLVLPQLHSLRSTPEVYSGGKTYPASPIKFSRVQVGPEFGGYPVITNIQIFNFDGEGTNEIIACDASNNSISLFSLLPDKTWKEQVIISDVAVPGHTTPVDIDQDGDIDIIVSILGNIMPDDGIIGRVELFEKQGDEFVRHVILDNVRRVADVQPGDFDGDGDIDLAVGVFGYNRGEVLWLENLGDFKFDRHELLVAPGTIHVPVADYDSDGDLDIAAIVTQDEEELWGFENLGNGQFKKRKLWMTNNLDLGGAGLVKADLDQDGDIDLILPAGDNLEDRDAYPQPYHGCYWFENKGEWKFEKAKISDLGGTYAADVGDLDADGDLDLVLVSMTNDWNRPGTASVVWLENDGHQNFTTWQVASEPIHIVTVAVGDIDGDQKPDIVAGSMNILKPFQRLGRVSAWLNRSKEGK